jgi:hypothetical protein
MVMYYGGYDQDANTSWVRIRIGSDGILNLFTRDDNNSIQFASYSGDYTNLTNVRMKNGEVYYNGALVKTLNDVPMTRMNGVNYPFTFSGYSNVDQNNLTGEMYGLKLNGSSVDLTYGLGSTTKDGGIIQTSAADSNERINFGMWLKGNNTDGWIPYTLE